MSIYKKIKQNDVNRETFQVNKTWTLNQASSELVQKTYTSGSSWKNNEYHTLSGGATAVSESYWHSLSFNFYMSVSTYEGFAQKGKNTITYGHKNKIDRTIDTSETKWINHYYSQGHISHNFTNPIHLNKFG